MSHFCLFFPIAPLFFNRDIKISVAYYNYAETPRDSSTAGDIGVTMTTCDRLDSVDLT